jgi:membrane protein required for colicin V production
MNPLDMVIVVIVSFCLIRGLFRGLVKELSSIIGVLVGFYAAYTYYAVLVRFVSKWTPHLAYLNIISFLFIFCSVFIVISIFGIIIKYILNISFLTWVDRIFGSIFGLIKGGLIVAIIVLALTAFLDKGTTVISRSILAPHITLLSEKMINVVPDDMEKNYKKKLNEFKKDWKRR